MTPPIGWRHDVRPWVDSGDYWPVSADLLENV
jgi:hypothetical protein